MAPRVLVIEHSPGTFEPGLLAAFDVDRIAWHGVSPDLLAGRHFDLIVPVVSAFSEAVTAFFDRLLKQSAQAPTLVVVPADDLSTRQCELVTQAADDFLTWPVRLDEWRRRVARLLGMVELDAADVSERLRREVGLAQLVGRHTAFRSAIDKIPLVAKSGSPCLITGETGTGKELCARAIHMLSPRRQQPFIPVDCAALPDHLFENEFFGHARGAFTDAHRDQKGLVGLAAGGTIFLDEVDSLSTSAQAKLLRFLQERTFRPLGAEHFCRVDVNVVAAMNRDPEALVREKGFRSDLYFRLNVIRLHLVPLRERRSDIALIARHFLATCAAELKLGPKRLAVSVLPDLMSYDWPGNVRELTNVLQHAAVLAPGPIILPEHLVIPGRQPHATPAPADPRDGLSFRQVRAMALESFERAYVTRLVEKHAGNVTHAAREAQKDRRAFGRLMKKYSISRRSPTFEA